MRNYTMILSTAILIATLFTVKAADAEEIVEIMLTANIDEERDYCLDIAGGKGKNAPLDKGLQAHTCYNYTGGILEDQGFDSALVSEGQFRIPYFNVCMSVTNIVEGAPIALEQCDDSDSQKFLLKSDGQMVSQIDPKLCVTVSSTEKREGRGGSPVHVMRPLSLQPCDGAKQTFRTWSINSL